MKVYSYDRKKGKRIFAGNIVGSTFRKEVKSTVHKLRLLNAYGISEDVLTRLKEAGIKEVRIVEADTKEVYQSTLSSWLLNGTLKDFGSGEQRFLPIKYMEKKSQPSLFV